MKKIFVCMIACGLAMACASSNQNKTGLTDQYSKYQILDQEFDNLSVANDNYDRVPSYEEQLSGSSYIQSSVARDKNTKPARTLTVQKTVVDARGNVLSGTSSDAITDQEVLTDEAQ